MVYHFNSRAKCCIKRQYFIIQFAVTALLISVPFSSYAEHNRIASLSPAMTEILFAIGAGEDVVSRTSECNYPTEALAVPAICGFDGKSISIEKIIALRPTLVLGAKGMHDWLMPYLKPLNIPLYLSKADTVCTVIEEILDVGNLTQHYEGALKTVHEMQEKLEKIPRTNGNVCVYWEVWNAPLMAAGGASFMNDIITYSGGKNIFSSINAAYPTVSSETLLTLNPSIIIMAKDAYKNKDSAIIELRRRAGWKDIDAVKKEQVVLIGDEAMRAGPRVADAIVNLSSIISAINEK